MREKHRREQGLRAAVEEKVCGSEESERPEVGS